MGQTCCQPAAPSALQPAQLRMVQALLDRILPPHLVLPVVAYLFWPPACAEMAVDCVLAGHPGAAAHLPVALQGAARSCTWQATPDVTLYMRTKVVEWLMHGSDVLGLDPEWRVLHRTVLLLDCCMQREAVPRNRLQLLAAAVLLLACKYEGYVKITSHNAADITNGACAAADISAMEWHAFQLLEFHVGVTTTWEWTHELAQRRKQPLTPLECYRLDASLLRHGPASRIAEAQRILCSSAPLVTHAHLQTRYPACSAAKSPPLRVSRILV